MARAPLGLLIAASFLAAGSRSANAQTVQDFFDGSVLHDIRLTMDPADWDLLHQRYSDKKTNYKCTFEWRDLKLSNAGLHTRGSGSLNPIKPGMAIEFAKYDANQRFLGLSAVYLRNFAEDQSAIHERLTMQVYAQMGLPYQRSAHARLFVNGTYVGLYETLEPLDDRFLLTRFGETNGYLYEGVGGLNYGFQDLGDDPLLYVPVYFDPKNHTDDPQGQRIVDMVAAINRSSDETFVAEVSKYLDLDCLMAFVAAEVALAEADGFLSSSGMTNFYLYRRMKDNRFYFLVWDKEMTFIQPDQSIWANIDANVLMQRALRSPVLMKRYLDAIHQASAIIGGPGGWLAQEIDREYEQIRAAMADDPNQVCMLGGGFVRSSEGAFEAAIGYLRVFAETRRAFLMQSLYAASWTASYGAPNPSTGAMGDESAPAAFLSPRELASIRLWLPVNSETRAASWPLPFELAGASVQVAGNRMPMVSVSLAGIQFQIPPELPCGPAALTVTWNGTTSQAMQVEIRPANPGILAVIHADGRAVTPTDGAAPGEMISVLATGLGPTYRDTGIDPPDGANAALEFPNAVSALVGGKPAEVLWSGLIPGSLLQLASLRLPQDLEPSAATGGSTTSLALSVLGEMGSPYPLAVR